MIVAAIASLSLLATPPERLHSAEDLREHLCAEAPTPLTALDPDMQRRVLRAVDVNERGVFFSAIGYLDGLPQAEVRAILAMFGMADYAHIVDGPTGDAAEPKAYDRIALSEAYCAGAEDLDAALDALPITTLERKTRAIDPHVFGTHEGAATRGEVVADMVAAHDRHFLGGIPRLHLAEADDWTLDALFNTLSALARETDHPPARRDLLAVYDELDRRGSAPLEDLHDTYLAMRDWDAAMALRAQHPDLAPPPPLASEADGRSVLVNALNGTLVPRSVPADYTGVLVLTTPRCTFSKFADAEIAEDKRLDRALSEGVWVLPPHQNLSDDTVLAYNQRRPTRPLTHLADPDEWPMLTAWATPRFYFLRDGEVVDTLDGWMPDRAEANRARLREGFAAIGEPVDRPLD